MGNCFHSITTDHVSVEMIAIQKDPTSAGYQRVDKKRHTPVSAVDRFIEQDELYWKRVYGLVK
jgi:hypothetical protein